MANHGYVIRCKEPYSMAKLGKLADKFVKENLKGVFKLERGEDLWVITLPGDEVNGVQFWVGSWYSSGDKKHKAVEIRHGHGPTFWWWVDYYLAAYLAVALKGKITDDGCDEIENPDLSRYEDLDKFRKGSGYHFDMTMEEYLADHPSLLVFTKHPKAYKKTLELMEQGRKMYEQFVKEGGLKL